MSPQARVPGFAMLDCLVALLLFALALSGACAISIRALRATHVALQESRAIDLAADLSESLRQASSGADARSRIEELQRRMEREMPVAGIDSARHASISELPATPTTRPAAMRQITLRWNDPPEGTHEISMPLAYAGPLHP